MKFPKINKKVILSILVSIAAIVAMLAPAIPAAADTADWPLKLTGASTYNMSKLEFEALAAAHPSNIISQTKNEVTTLWKGVALWRLVALVDDGDPDTLNESLASTISVQGHSIPIYASNALTPDQWYGTNGDNKEYVIVANKYSADNGVTWTDLAADAYPTRITGTVGGVLLPGTSRPGQLVELELLNLQASSASVSISPASLAVANGATFNINLDVNLVNRWSRGWQETVNFDAAKMSANSVTEGTFLSNYATANGGGTVSGGSATIDNVGGHVTIPGYAITGAGTGGPTGTGTLCTISFTANAGVNDIASISLSLVKVKDVFGSNIPDVTLAGGTVIIGTLPLPDLVVSATSTTPEADPTMYTITYTITNNGQAPSSASTTSISIDGTPITIACPALGIGASDTQTTPPQTLSGNADSILVTADSTGAVAESNESNNTRSTSYSYTPAQPGDVTVSGTTQDILDFVLPDPVSWDPLNIGWNSADRTMKVTSNQNWEVTVKDYYNNGYMTKYDGTIYDQAVHLHDALYLVAYHLAGKTEFYLSGIAQLLASGTPAEQDLYSGGDTRAVEFWQKVYYVDPALHSPYYYQIVVTFTASPEI